ncbi:LysE family translocator [Marinomonas transparens]|uniref:LysE family translocator n=1 Tax=Marinomonas transparens TaxID=2795388 RepID=A0A934JJV8_9GAMM|nr:LysE family translocator [Marinomonas transparens]MBJ7537450.1 LysE family translocator [Marinomonas transparens]
MLDYQTVLTYLAILLGFVFIPGPAMLLTLARASGSGARVGIATGLGIAVGDLLHTLMAVVGVSAIIMTSAVLFSVVKFLGAGYLIYLGIRAFIEKVDHGAVLASNQITSKVAFRQAVLAEVLNPKSALFFMAFLPHFVNPDNGFVALQLLELGVLFVLVGLLGTVVVAFSAGWIGSLLRRNPAIARWQGKFVGSIYCLLGARLAIQDK